MSLRAPRSRRATDAPRVHIVGRALSVLTVAAACSTMEAAVSQLFAAAPLPEPPPATTVEPPDPAAPGSIRTDELRAHISALASPHLEGRDSPSRGLRLAAAYVAECLADAGATGAGEDGTFVHSFARRLPRPVEAGCEVVLLDVADGDDRAPGDDHSDGVGAAATPLPRSSFVPIWGAEGTAEGPLVFVGYGIASDDEDYDELRGDLDGVIAVLLEGEPEDDARFDGPEVSAAADLYGKLVTLRGRGVAGALVVRTSGEAVDGSAPLGFRHTWAQWSTEPRARRFPDLDVPALEITRAAARTLLGFDALTRELAGERPDPSPPPPTHTGRRARIASQIETADVPLENVVGVVRGRDPALADEYVVIGAHYDHVGVDPRGRIGLGADDNASGVAALLEIVEALAVDPPRRSVLACAFAAEEDGLLGSRAFVADPPIPLASIAAMLNLDMIGRGRRDEVVVFGLDRNPHADEVLERALALLPTGVRKVDDPSDANLFRRSDHYAFHLRGVPSLFFFEGVPVSRNADYHTWRDTVEHVDVEKVAATTRLVYATCWILAEDDDRLPSPRR